MQASARDLRVHAARLLEAVERGEEVTITYRGKPRARLVPVQGERGRGGIEARSALFGAWRDRDDAADVEALVNRLRESRF